MRTTKSLVTGEMQPELMTMSHISKLSVVQATNHPIQCGKVPMKESLKIKIVFECVKEMPVSVCIVFCPFNQGIF